MRAFEIFALVSKISKTEEAMKVCYEIFLHLCGFQNIPAVEIIILFSSSTLTAKNQGNTGYE